MDIARTASKESRASDEWIVHVSMETLSAIRVGWSRTACRHPDKRLTLVLYLCLFLLHTKIHLHIYTHLHIYITQKRFFPLSHIFNVAALPSFNSL